MDGRNPVSKMRPLFYLVLATAALSLACEDVPPTAVEGFSPTKMSLIAMGQTQEALVAAVGKPLSEYRSPEMPDRVLLTYATPGAVWVGGEYRTKVRGYDSTVLLVDGRVDGARVYNSETGVVCDCSKQKCVKDWAAPCAVGPR